MDDVTGSHKGPNTDDDLESARSELFTVTRQVALLNCASGGEVCYPGLPCIFAATSASVERISSGLPTRPTECESVTSDAAVGIFTLQQLAVKRKEVKRHHLDVYMCPAAVKCSILCDRLIAVVRCKMHLLFCIFIS